MKWIEEQTKLRSLDDYATSIAKFLLDTTQAQPALREDLTVRALRLIETDALAHSLGAFVDDWRAFAGRERKAVWRLLRSARKDVEWLRAVVLTRVEPPPELICLIASRPDFFHLSPKEQIATLPAQLLAKCLCSNAPTRKIERFGGIEPYLKAYVPEIVSPPTIRMVHSSERQGESPMLFAPICPKGWPDQIASAN